MALLLAALVLDLPGGARRLGHGQPRADGDADTASADRGADRRQRPRRWRRRSSRPRVRRAARPGKCSLTDGAGTAACWARRRTKPPADAIVDELNRAGWQVEEQNIDVGGVALANNRRQGGKRPADLAWHALRHTAVADLDPVEGQSHPARAWRQRRRKRCGGPAGAGALARQRQALPTKFGWLSSTASIRRPAASRSAPAPGRWPRACRGEPLPQAVVLLDSVGAAGPAISLSTAIPIRR